MIEKSTVIAMSADAVPYGITTLSTCNINVPHFLVVNKPSLVFWYVFYGSTLVRHTVSDECVHGRNRPFIDHPSSFTVIEKTA